MNIAIVTPTYNRIGLLNRLYESLLKQSNYSFTWIVVDDGSMDNTSEYIEKLDAPFNIRYFKQENSGKVKALNLAFDKNNDIDFFLIVDSDDYLLEYAIEIVLKTSNKYLMNKNVGAIFFRYQFENGEVIGQGKNTPSGEILMSRIEHDAKYDKVDGCIGYFQRTVKKYKYPTIDNEKYMGPTVIQLMMSEEYKIAFINRVIGVAEYQLGGLTNSGRRIRILSPISMLIYTHYMQDSQFNWLISIKYGIMSNTYFYYAKRNNKEHSIVSQLRIPKVLRIPGYLLAKIWEKKYL